LYPFPGRPTSLSGRPSGSSEGAATGGRTAGNPVLPPPLVIILSGGKIFTAFPTLWTVTLPAAL
jgi:hypothetical protein